MKSNEGSSQKSSKENLCGRASKELDCTTSPFQWWYEIDEPSTIRLGLHLRLLHAENTGFQKLEIYEHDLLGRILILDDILQTTQADEFIYHEMVCHIPLLGSAFIAREDYHPEVLIIGGGDGGLLREVLNHARVQRVVMVELDEAVIRASKQFLNIHGNFEDPRVNLIIGDGFEYVGRASTHEHPFDVILVDSSDPVGPGESLFSAHFYKSLGQCLKPHGVMVRHLGLPHIQKSIFIAGVRRLAQAFKGIQIFRATIPSYIGGEMGFAACTRDGHAIDVPYRDYTGRYYNTAMHRAAFALPTSWQQMLADLVPITGE